MARNTRASNGKKKMQAAPMEIFFDFSIPAGASTGINPYLGFIDLSQAASIVNRRFYRQGLNWCVNGIKLFTYSASAGTPTSGSLSLSKLPQTWVMSNAWEKGFRAWQKMNNEALSESDSVKPKFLDFKIFANAEHHEAGFDANLLPFTLATNPFTSGEWSPSKFVIPLGNQDPGDTEEFEIVAVGASYPGNSPVSTLNAVSLIEGYASSRGLPDILDPNVPADSADSQGIDPENWLQAIFNEGTDQSTEVLETMITENNRAPYPFENDGVNLDTMYPNGANQGNALQIHDFSFITGTTIGGETYIPGGTFPCGLIQVRGENNDEENDMLCFLKFEMVPGHHRGYLAESMTEM